MYASMPMVEYFKEQSLASCARRSATKSSARMSSFPMMKVIRCVNGGSVKEQVAE